MSLDKNNKNSLWLSSQYSLILVLSLVGLKLNLLTLGSQVFSIWVLLFSIWGVGSAVDFGFGISTVKFVAQYKSDYAKVNKIISTGLFLFMALGIVIAVLGCFIAELVYIGNPKIVPHNLTSQARTICLLSGAIFYVQYLTIVFRSILEGHEDFARTSKIAIANSLLVFVFIVIAYFSHFSPALLGLLYLIAAVVQLFVFLISFKMYYRHLSIGITHVNVATFKEICKFSISVQATYFLGSLIDPVTKYLIGNFSENKLIPPYEIAKRFSLAVSGLFSFAFKNTLPSASRLSGKEEYLAYVNSDVIKLSRFGIGFSGIFFGMAALVFACIFNFFYHFNQSIILFLLLAMAESCNNAGYVLYVFILGLGKVWFLTMLQALNVLCIGFFLWCGYKMWGNPIGLLGFFVSILIGNVAMLLYIKKTVPIKMGRFYKQINLWKLLVLDALLLCAVLILLHRPDTWLIVQICQCVLCGVLFFPEINRSAKKSFLFFKSLFSDNNYVKISK